MNPHQASIHHHPLVRFLACVRPQLKLVVGAALMGVGKFTLPLAFPFAFKYVVDVLLQSQPRPDRIPHSECIRYTPHKSLTVS